MTNKQPPAVDDALEIVSEFDIELLADDVTKSLDSLLCSETTSDVRANLRDIITTAKTLASEAERALAKIS